MLSIFNILLFLSFGYVRQNSDGVLKLSKLRKLTLKSIRESGVTEDETKLIEMLEQKVDSSDLYFLN